MIFWVSPEQGLGNFWTHARILPGEKYSAVVPLQLSGWWTQGRGRGRRKWARKASEVKWKSAYIKQAIATTVESISIPEYSKSTNSAARMVGKIIDKKDSQGVMFRKSTFNP